MTTKEDFLRKSLVHPSYWDEDTDSETSDLKFNLAAKRSVIVPQTQRTNHTAGVTTTKAPDADKDKAKDKSKDTSKEKSKQAVATCETCKNCRVCGCHCVYV